MGYFRRNWVSFRDIFRDENTINEKSVVGFISFVIMILFAIADVITGLFGMDLKIHEFIYSSFMYITLGAFGIAEIGKVFNRDSDGSSERDTYRHDYRYNDNRYSDRRYHEREETPESDISAEEINNQN